MGVEGLGQPATAVEGTGSNAFRQLLSGAFQYSLGGLAARALTVVSLPIYLHFLTPAEFGAQAIALLNEALLLIVAGYAITNAVTKYYMEAAGSHQGESIVIGTAVLALAATGILVGLLWQLLAVPISKITLDASADNVNIIRLIGLSFFASLFFNLATTVWQLRHQTITYSVSNMLKYTLAMLLGILFVGPFSGGALGVVLGWTLASVVAGALALAWLLRKFEMRFDYGILLQLAKFGFPLLPAALITLALNGADRYLLKELAGLDVVGAYVVVITIAGALNLALVTPFKLVWAPLMWKMRHQPEEVTFHRRTLTYFVTLQVFALCVVAVFADLILGIISEGDPYLVAVSFAVPISYAGFVLFGVYDIVSAGYFFEERTYFYTLTVVASTVLNIALNILLIPPLGLWGSSVAFAASYLVFAALSYVFGQKFFKVPYEWGRLCRVILIGASVCLVGLLVRSIGGYGGYLLGICSLVCFPLLLLWTSFFDESELESGRRTLALLVFPRGVGQRS